MAILLAAITAVVLYEVVARYFFNRPTIWAVDFTEYSLVYLTFFGAAWALRDHTHVRVDILIKLIPPRQALVLSMLVGLASAGVMAVFVWVGAALVWEAYVKGQTMLKAWPVPRWVILLPIPAASLLMIIEFLRQAWETLQSLRRGVLAQARRQVELGITSIEDERAIF